LQYDVESGGRTRRVSVDRTGDSFAVRVGEHTYRVDAARIDGQTLSLIVDSRAVYEAVIGSERGAERLTVRIGPFAVPVTVDGRRTRRPRSGGSAASSGRIVASMPGKIVRVLVEPGQRVRAREPVVVVEAMKMENALRADHDGTVAEVHVREGALVEAGALLIVIR
jgi:biotin carboxyl carrier protein